MSNIFSEAIVEKYKRLEASTYNMHNMTAGSLSPSDKPSVACVLVYLRRGWPGR
jgi:hypothetical protein